MFHCRRFLCITISVLRDKTRIVGRSSKSAKQTHVYPTVVVVDGGGGGGVCVCARALARVSVQGVVRIDEFLSLVALRQTADGKVYNQAHKLTETQI